LISSLGLVCYLANLLILLSLHPKLPFCLIHCFLMLHGFVKLWVLFNNSLLRARIFVLLLTESVSLCMLLQILIRLPWNASCVIFGVRHPMACILLVVPLLPYMVLQMQIGHAMLRIENLWVVILCSLVRRRFYENPVSNAQLLALLLKLSTKP